MLSGVSVTGPRPRYHPQRPRHGPAGPDADWSARSPGWTHGARRMKPRAPPPPRRPDPGGPDDVPAGGTGSRPSPASRPPAEVKQLSDHTDIEEIAKAMISPGAELRDMLRAIEAGESVPPELRHTAEHACPAADGLWSHCGGDPGGWYPDAGRPRVRPACQIPWPTPGREDTPAMTADRQETTADWLACPHVGRCHAPARNPRQGSGACTG